MRLKQKLKLFINTAESVGESADEESVIMPLSRIQMYKRKVVSKYNFILQELERTNGILEKAKLEIDEKVGAFLKEGEDLLPQFNQIDEDLELFHSKLCFIQEELENDKLSIDNDAACTLTYKKQGISENIQNGTSIHLQSGGDTEQMDSVSSSSSQNDKTSSKNIFCEQVTSQFHCKGEKKVSTNVSACGRELNIPPFSCNESVFSNSGLPSDVCSSQHNAMKINTDPSMKEISNERCKMPQIVKSSSVMEQVSSSDGSSVYGTVSSVCSEVHTTDKNESVTNDTVKLIHHSTSLAKQNIGNCQPGSFKQNSGEDLRTHCVGVSWSSGIPYPDLEIGSTVAATVQDIMSPSDFWIQIDSEYMKELCPVEDLVAFYDGLSDIKPNMYCLAPFREQKGYFRAKILELPETGRQKAKVLYIDQGCKGFPSTSTLKVLPPSLQKIPSIAVHCALHGVTPMNGQWSHQAIQEFKNTIEVSRTEIRICCRAVDTYFVKVSVIACIPENEKYTYDMAEFMHIFGYAVKTDNTPSIQHSVTAFPERCASVASHDSSARTTPKLSHQSSQSKDLSIRKNEETSLTTKNELLLDNISSDQRILTDDFNQGCDCDGEPDQILFGGNMVDRKAFVDNKESDIESVVANIVQDVQMNATNISNFQNGTEKNCPTNSINESTSCVNNDNSDRPAIGKFVGEGVQVHVINVSKNQKDGDKNLPENTLTESTSLVNSMLEPPKSSSVSHSISTTDSCCVDQNVQVPVNNSPCMTDNLSNTLSMSQQSSCNDFDWNVKIPISSQKFMKKAKFIVMLSAIVSPSDFYVNLAMPTSNELDELQEHMLSVYQNFDTSMVMLPPINKLCGMFCCCQFAEDKNWYRVQVLEICSPVENAQNPSTEVRIQYVDYGNEAEVNISELLPLKKEFATHPPFSFHCALAGIKPKLVESSYSNNDGNTWDEEAVTRFKCLASFDKCYTAEIATTVMYDGRKTPIPVYLWDNISAKDILINIILVEQGAADGTDLELLNCPAEGNLQDMDLWDPMSADFHSTLNSYGVNLNDPEVATVGYKANDEAYVCKFFAATGKCHRGDKCYYQHIFTTGDSTIDQEPVEYLGKAVTLPDVESTVFVMISAMFNPGHFFVVFPFGTKSLESVYSEIQRCAPKEDDIISEFMDNMNKYYNRNHCRKENTAVAPAIGDLVAVKWQDNLWYRGRVCEVYSIDAPLVVYFVDFGNCECIERTDIYVLETQFRHFPFQAVECHLHGIEAKVSKEGQWSHEAKTEFQELTEGKILVAHIKSMYGSSLYVELFSFVKNQEFSINDYLVQKSYGQYMKQDGCNNSSYTNSQKDDWNKAVVFIPA